MARRGCFLVCPGALAGVPATVLRAARGAYVIAVDGGLRHCRGLGLSPREWIGDADSLPARHAGAEALRRIASDFAASVRLLPRDKDMSDLEAALGRARQAWRTGLWRGEITVLGAQGGRFDHELANVLAAREAVRTFGLPMAIWSFGPRGAWVATNDRILRRVARGRPFSVFALERRMRVTIVGARFPESGTRRDGGGALLLDRPASRGLSNEGMGRVVRVKLSAGVGLVVFPHASVEATQFGYFRK